MTFPVLHIFEASGLLVYALPAHTSESIEPLDGGVFGPFKEHPHVSVEGLSSSAEVIHTTYLTVLNDERDV